MTDDRDVSFKLVREIKLHPVLYNYLLPEYSNKIKVDRAWNEISKNLRISTSEAKERWRNIRSTYIRSRKTIRSTLTSRPKKRYYLAKYLTFVEPYLRSRSRLHVRPKLDENIDEGLAAFKEEQISDGDNNDSDDPLCSIQLEPLTVEVPPKPEDTESRKQSIEHTAHQVEAHDVHQELQSIFFPGISNGVPPHPIHYFFLSLMGEFDSMTDQQTRTFKIKVLELIDKIKQSDNQM